MAERRRGEFAFIRERLRPLTAGAPGALDLADDAARLEVSGQTLVVTADTVVAGVHFLESDGYASAARRLLRVNLSDLAAKAATPIGYMLAVAWPQTAADADMDAFVDGLAADQKTFGLVLYGGDTTATPGPLTATATMFGAAVGASPTRGGARPGDLIYVSGTIGDSALGLRLSRGEELAGVDAQGRQFLCERYRLPIPRMALAEALAAHATAAIDLSDGLLADAGHVAEQSRVRLTIEAERLPLSPPARAWVEAQADRAAALAALATGGDDYEILCALGPGEAGAFEAAAGDVGVAVSRIGTAETGSGARLVDVAGRPIPVARAGFTHF